MTDLDGDQRDRRTLGIPDPNEHALPHSEHETRIRFWGTLCRWAGFTLLTLDTIGTLIVAYLGHGNAWDDDTIGRTFGGLTCIIVGMAGAALVAAGLVELMQRQQRTLIRRAMGRADRNAAVGHANNAAIGRTVEAVEQNGRLIAEAVATLAGIEKRLLALETAVEAVPGYAEGLAKGAKVAASVLGADKD